MRRIFLACCLFFGVFEVNASESMGMNSDSPEATVSIDELIFEKDAILVHINGVLRSVRSLEKREGQWIAQFDFGKEAGYCQRGHDLCYYCRLCHRIGCWYYVEPCWKK